MSRLSTSLVTIIIPVKKFNHFVDEAMIHINQLKWSKYEVIILTDKNEIKNKSWLHTRVVSSGLVGPAKKRDLGAKLAKGTILAFIDDDAYPSPNWLKYAVANFSDEKIVAVGGPGVTPPRASFLEQVSGWINASPIGAGPYGYRCLPGKKQLVDDYPAMNFLVRKKDFTQVGGFNSHFFPGEDTKLCLDLINLGKKIVYEPKALVFHHRREIWRPFLKQTGNYAIHRGYFVRKLPQTSARLAYFMPSGLVINVFLWLISWYFAPGLTLLFGSSLILYSILLIINSSWICYKSHSVGIAILSLPGLVLTHLWYGLRFLQGLLLVNKLKQ